MARVVARRMTQARDGLYRSDALRVLVCGSGSPLPSPHRAQACVAVIAGGQVLVFDIGTGAAENLARWQIDTRRVRRVFLTHFHSDHVGDLYALNLQGWVAGRSTPLEVHGPPGVQRVVDGFEEAYALDRGYRVLHHGADFLNPEAGHLRAVSFESTTSPSVVYQNGGLEVSAFAVDHDPVRPAVGYRVSYRGRSVVISGDTTKSAGLVEAARGADVLLHEALAPHVVATIARVAHAKGRDRIAKIMHDIPSYHTSPVAAAEAANEAGVRLLVLYHLVPAPPSGIGEDVFLRGVDDVRSDVTVASDGLLLVLPVDSRAIQRHTL